MHTCFIFNFTFKCYKHCFYYYSHAPQSKFMRILDVLLQLKILIDLIIFKNIKLLKDCFNCSDNIELTAHYLFYL